jgi:DNA repair protein RadA/Sms
MLLSCAECGQPASQWAGRCPACGAWGSITEQTHPSASRSVGAPEAIQTLQPEDAPAQRVPTGFEGVDRVLGGGLVPASVLLLAGEPGIGKSTLLLHLIARLSMSGHACLLASGEESRGQIAARAARVGVSGSGLSFVPGRELPEVIDAATSLRPFLLAVDSVQTLRDPDSGSAPGGPAQVRTCCDRLVGLAKSEGIAVALTGHVTKDGDVAGPRTLEHAVDTVLTFDGDPRSGLRILSSGKNRFGAEGETCWFEMSPDGLMEADPVSFLAPGSAEPGSATALVLAGRRAFALEVQALAISTEGPARRQSTGLDPRRFALMAAVLERAGGIPVSRMELFGATAGGIRVEDPGSDLAVVAALASSAAGRPIPDGSAFVGEVSLTGQVRPVPGMRQRIAAAARAGVRRVIVPAGSSTPGTVGITEVRHVRDALGWVTEGRGRKVG